MNHHGRNLILVCLAACGLAASLAAAAEGTATALHFRNGDYLHGVLEDSRQRNELVWKSDAFTSPLTFPLQTVQSVQFPLDLNAAAPQGPYCFQLAGGDVLYGSLKELDARVAVIDATGLGTLHVDRALVERISRVSAADLIFSGPNGLGGWQASLPAPAAPNVRRVDFLGAGEGMIARKADPPGSDTPVWRDEGGQLVTDRTGAMLRRDFRTGPQARFEIELSYADRPNFELALAVAGEHQSGRQEFRLEVWDKVLVAVRETQREADFASLLSLPPGPGRVHLQIYIDQAQGRLLVLSAAGETLADLTLPNDKAPVLPKFTKGQPQLLLKPKTGQPEWASGWQLINLASNLKLERLTVGRWSGAVPHVIDAGNARILQTDGSILQGELLSYDAAAQTFAMAVGGQSRTIDEQLVQDLALARDARETPARTVRVLEGTGTRVSGELIGVQGDRIALECPGIREPLSLSIGKVHAIVVLRPAATEAATSTPPSGREGRLELAGVSIHGRLIDTSEESESLVFQPRHGQTSAPLTPESSGRLVYRDPPPPAPKPQGAALRAAPRIVAGVRTLLGAKQPAPPRPAQSQTSAVLHLRSGDAVTCSVKRIDEEGVHLQSEMAATTFVPHAEIKVLELDPNAAPIKIDKTKKERLLTLPRMQRNNPPTHLIRSREGDYLRGRLLAMDDLQLQVELRLETKALAREQVARIIWLHADEMPDGKPAAPREAVAEGARVQAVPRSGNRLTFFANQLKGDMLSGHSRVLGACQVNLADVDQLLIGDAIEKNAATLAFHNWKLKPAPEPLPTPEPGAPGSGEGLDSVLVGKPAPAIDLEFVDGKRFHLADYKNKVVVLDFWASWCGPCLQVMPQVDAVAREFADRDVHLVAINLEEAADRVTSALERLKLETKVALDKDGRVAERYGATSIPQTVIIDREGKVARLFVGGGARFDEQLRQALKSVLDPPTAGQ